MKENVNHVMLYLRLHTCTKSLLSYLRFASLRIHIPSFFILIRKEIGLTHKETGGVKINVIGSLGRKRI